MYYDILTPEKFTEEWVRDHVHEVFMDDARAIDLLRCSVAGTDPATRLKHVVAYQPIDRVFYGYELRVPVQTKKNAVYQDGSAVKGESVTLYHSTPRRKSK